ncbi:hypothetical protein VNO77_04100 [Canavalia gladiata]|uniref:Uncharacterized protein n=1 Tax=Canavalia gladiata TaxID=3824 RepID=A0AAN9N2F4_CANGL
MGGGFLFKKRFAGDRELTFPGALRKFGRFRSSVVQPRRRRDRRVEHWVRLLFVKSPCTSPLNLNSDLSHVLASEAYGTYQEWSGAEQHPITSTDNKRVSPCKVEDHRLSRSAPPTLIDQFEKTRVEQIAVISLAENCTKNASGYLREPRLRNH